jgi:hypothetical protein
MNQSEHPDTASNVSYSKEKMAFTGIGAECPLRSITDSSFARKASTAEPPSSTQQILATDPDNRGLVGSLQRRGNGDQASQ